MRPRPGWASPRRRGLRRLAHGRVGPAAPIDVVAAIAPRPLLLMHGTRTGHPLRALGAPARGRGEPVELWILEGGEHAALFNRAPEEWERRVAASSARWLGGTERRAPSLSRHAQPEEQGTRGAAGSGARATSAGSERTSELPSVGAASTQSVCLRAPGPVSASKRQATARSVFGFPFHGEAADAPRLSWLVIRGELARLEDDRLEVGRR